ncbi:MAG: PrsW family glutamic-type intramembrane protease [Treponema sp.]|nr:PrsW family glutamic-type intramembrane protease [Treponema sp.]
MALILPILLCFVPLLAVFVVLVFWGKMKVLHLLWALGAGLLCVLPVSVIQFFLGMVPVFSNQNLLFILLKSVLLYGLIEELCKLGIGFVLPKKNYTTLQFLLISFFFGLSLGCFESIIYFLDHLQKSSAIGGVLLYKPVFTRMFTSDLIHTFCSGLLGLFIYNARQKDFHVSLIFLAVVLHGVYDFFAGFANSFKYFSLAVILFAAIECRVKYLIYNRKEK